MRKILLAGVASLGLMIAPAHADEAYDSGKYDVTVGNPGFGLTYGGLCPDVCIGGYIFGAPGLMPTAVTVNDVSGTDIGVTVGQDGPDAGITAGDAANEASISGCGGTIDLTASTVPFDPALPVSVFVDAISLDCDGVGTNGTIDLFVQM